MKRRGFLSLIGVGAVAGPGIAKNALTEVRPLTGYALMNDMPIGIPGDAGSAPKGMFSAFDRIAKLKRLISGEEQEAATDDPWRWSFQKKLSAEHNIHALGSVSTVSKLRILSTASKKIEQEERRKHWLQELMHLTEGE
jgi:hypothetical protein